MKIIRDIQLLLKKLDVQPADSLENQDLDCKEWNIRSMNDSVALVIELAVCMANGETVSENLDLIISTLPRSRYVCYR